MKKFSFLKLVAALCCLAAIAAASFVRFSAQSVQTSAQETSLQVKVTDLNGTPICGAKVFVIESKTSRTTDASGAAPPVVVPFAQTELTKLCGGDISFVTVVVSKDGYADAVLFNCLVFKDRMRNGPVIRLFEKSQTSAPFIATVEVPPEKCTQEFIEKAKRL